jgi:hypothetical protein
MSEAQDFAPVKVHYDQTPLPEKSEGRFEMVVPTDGARPAAKADIELKEPGLVRDLLLTMSEILASDLRFKASDRSDYLAYLLKQGQRATKELWEAQQSFLQRRYAEEETEEAPLDPLLTIGDEDISLEVFSADESAYARLVLHAGRAYEAASPTPGTTHIDLMAAVGAITELRSYRSATMRFSPSSQGAEERQIHVPYRWVRALSQMQAASTLPATEFEIAPIDLYNVLFTLRTKRAKKPPRALRYELVPGQKPRLVLEPWEQTFEASGPEYQGNHAAIVRTWGRRRLSLLSRILPHCSSVKVRLVGGGLPAFYVFDLGAATLTMSLSGWTDSGWAGIATFDLFGSGEDAGLPEKVQSSLRQGAKTLEELASDLGVSQEQARNALLGCVRGGDVVHDLGTQRFHWRPLFSEPIDPERLLYRDEKEESAHRLLAVEGQVRITTIHDLGAEGTRIEGEVEDKEAHRTYSTAFTIDREGRTVDASCTSPQFRRAGLETEEGRKLVRAETRTLIRRDKDEVTMMRVSLNDRKVVVRWGPDPAHMRMTQQVFSSADEAREDYFGRLSSCADKGFIDASAAEAM